MRKFEKMSEEINFHAGKFLTMILLIVPFVENCVESYLEAFICVKLGRNYSRVILLHGCWKIFSENEIVKYFPQTK